MSAWRLTGPELRDWVDGLLAEGRTVVAPVRKDALRIFRPIRSAAEASLEQGKTRWSPKEYLFPRTERVFSYAARGSAVTIRPVQDSDQPQVLFGVSPCDAAGFRRLDAIFLGEPGDALYASRRGRSVVVSLACVEAGPECFCAAVGGHPAGEEGVDVQLLPLGEDWIVRSLTAGGEEVTRSLVGRPAATEADLRSAREPADRLAAEVGRKPIAREWAAVLERSFEAPLWDAIGMQCMGCSICNYLCPSCSCFDIQDSGSAWCGDRCRSWDSCTFALFTRHASGHNPRATQPARYRQRVLHKLAYYPATHDGQFMCVGCGRCARYCPGGLSIQDTALTVLAAEGSLDA